MIYLPNSCYCSDIQVFPRDWKTQRASIKKKWRIWYRFYDPLYKEKYPKGRLIAIKSTINLLKTVEQRRDFALKQIDIEMDLMLNEGYNHITGIFTPPLSFEGEIRPDTLLLPALEQALKLLDLEKYTRLDMESTLRYFGTSAKKLGLQYRCISEMRLKHIKAIFLQIGQDKKSWNPARYNRYRAYLRSIFNELVDQDAIDHNPIINMKKKVVEQKIREALSAQQRRDIDMHLRKKKLMTFRLFLRIFFHSGGRMVEMLSLKGHQVNLQEQYFIVTIRKGQRKMQVKKTIRNCALRYWKMAMAGCGPDDFVFSRGLRPGPESITRPQLTRRWEMHVKAPKAKGGLGITADIYSLKHSNSTETSEKYDEVVAAAQNSHTSTAMVVNIYDTKYSERNHRELKKVVVDF